MSTAVLVLYVRVWRAIRFARIEKQRRYRGC